MAKERNLYISLRDLKELLVKAVDRTYEEISIEYNEESELVIEIKTGHFTEEISFKDERVITALGLKSLNLKLADVVIDETRYSFIVGAKDEDQYYLFQCIKSD